MFEKEVETVKTTVEKPSVELESKKDYDVPIAELMKFKETVTKDLRETLKKDKLYENTPLEAFSYEQLKLLPRSHEPEAKQPIEKKEEPVVPKVLKMEKKVFNEDKHTKDKPADMIVTYSGSLEEPTRHLIMNFEFPEVTDATYEKVSEKDNITVIKLFTAEAE